MIPKEVTSASIFFDRLSSDGYDLFPNSLSLTAPKFLSYAINPKVNFNLNDNSKIKYSEEFYSKNRETIFN